ncbi:hypothetical protein EYF80_010610 [Liparis tanakae]|uniref:Uncharacterized protein n=1 Tax=Liparis tanakae TaxID=230148 RepID=A0A4Z2IPM6_9TELE|nr:hypothetical protein EYF80_010610 [Liparis tanakae]
MGGAKANCVPEMQTAHTPSPLIASVTGAAVGPKAAAASKTVFESDPSPEMFYPAQYPSEDDTCSPTSSLKRNKEIRSYLETEPGSVQPGAENCGGGRIFQQDCESQQDPLGVLKLHLEDTVAV